MALRPLLPILVATLAVSFLVACGGDGGSDVPTASSTNEGASGSPAATAVVNGSPAATEAPAGEETPDANGAAATPTAFEALRDELLDDLAGIGVNIGAVPEDVRAALLARCEALSTFADADRVEAICDAVARAMDSGDSGLIDLVLDELAELAAE